MRSLFTILALAALLSIPPQPASSGGVREVRAQAPAEARDFAWPMGREQAQRLARRVEEAEQRFRATFLDLDRLDIPQAALQLDRELCRIEDEAIRLQAVGRLRDTALEDLVETALGDAGRARARMEEVESLGSTAHSFLRLLREMRAARRKGHLDTVLALYSERRSNSLPEQWAQPVRGILEELDGLRVEVTMQRQALVMPR